VQGALSGVSDFRDAALQAVARLSADHAGEGEFDANVLSDRPIPAEHKFSRLAWIPIFYTWSPSFGAALIPLLSRLARAKKNLGMHSELF
jgi:hypothetical protein